MSQNTIKTLNTQNSIGLQVTSAAKSAGIYARSDGEVTYRATNVQTVFLYGGPDTAAVVFYDLNDWSFVEAAEHVERLARDMGVDPHDAPSRNVSVHIKGGGCALPLSIARETPAGEPAVWSATANDAPRCTGVGGWVAVHTGVPAIADAHDAAAARADEDDAREESRFAPEENPEGFEYDEVRSRESGPMWFVDDDDRYVHVYQRSGDNEWTVEATPTADKSARRVNEDGLLTHDAVRYEDRDAAVEVAKQAIARGIELTDEVAARWDNE